MQKVRIEWIDSHGAPNDWEFREGLKPLKPAKCETVGFLMDDKPDYKTLAFSISEEQVCGRITIPKECILSMYELISKS
jgi:hypothetical protein